MRNEKQEGIDSLGAFSSSIGRYYLLLNPLFELF